MPTHHNIGGITILSADESESACDAVASFEVSDGSVQGFYLIDAKTRIYTNGHLVPSVEELVRWFKSHRAISVDVTEKTRHGFPFAENARFTSKT